MFALLIPSAGLSAAAGEIQVVTGTGRAPFCPGRRVSICRRKSSSQITEVNLFYHETLELAVNRAYPTFTPGDQVTAQYTWQLLPGEVPVGAQIQYYWVLKDANGQQLQTPTKTVAYNDTRFELAEDQPEQRQPLLLREQPARANTLLGAAVAALLAHQGRDRRFAQFAGEDLRVRFEAGYGARA